jgi:hypothetical protein
LKADGIRSHLSSLGPAGHLEICIYFDELRHAKLEMTNDAI